MEMPSITECVVYAVLNYAPYAALGLYAFRTQLRFSRRITIVLFLLSILLQCALFTAGCKEADPIPLISTYLSTFINIGVYFGAVKARWGRKLFNLFMLQNIANCTSVIAKCLEGRLFPQYAEEPYQWSNILCLTIVLVVELPPLVIYINHFFTEKIRDTIGPRLWAFVWVIPLYFMLIWFDRFYYSGTGSLFLSLQPKTGLVMLLYIFGQLMIYGCIAKMVMYYKRNFMLQEENARLEQQKLQYDHISSRIQEASVLKHDLRHSLVLMKNYCDHGEIEKLKGYIDQYVEQFSQSTIRYCDNTALNALLVYYQGFCQNLCIEYQVKLSIPENLPFTDVEVTVLFGNLLENAVQACADDKVLEKRISVTGSVLQNNFVFCIENTYANSICKDRHGSFLSTRHSGTGIGTESVKQIVETKHGSIRFEPGDTTFSVLGTVLL